MTDYILKTFIIYSLPKQLNMTVAMITKSKRRIETSSQKKSPRYIFMFSDCMCISVLYTIYMFLNFLLYVHFDNRIYQYK